MKKIFGIIGGFLFLGLFTFAQADQTGDCTAGDEFCEQNSLATTNTTTTTNTNDNIKNDIVTLQTSIAGIDIVALQISIAAINASIDSMYDDVKSLKNKNDNPLAN